MRRHGKPHTEQDQIGRDTRVRPGPCRLGASQPPGRSLEPRSNARPRGMTVPREQSRGQNSAYRSGCHNSFESVCRSAQRPVSLWGFGCMHLGEAELRDRQTLLGTDAQLRLSGRFTANLDRAHRFPECWYRVQKAESYPATVPTMRPRVRNSF